MKKHAVIIGMTQREGMEVERLNDDVYRSGFAQVLGQTAAIREACACGVPSYKLIVGYVDVSHRSRAQWAYMVSRNRNLAISLVVLGLAHTGYILPNLVVTGVSP